MMELLGSIFFFIAGLFIVLVSVAVALHVDGSDKICRFAKYLFIGISGLYAMYIGIHFQYRPQDFIWLLALFFVVWRKLFSLLEGNRRRYSDRVTP